LLTLYDFAPSGNCYKVRLLLAQLGRAYERVPVDILKRESRTPGFLAINPNGRVPAVRLDDGRVLAESNAIAWYLAEGTSFLPDDAFDRADVLRWMFFEQYSHEPYIATVRFWITELGAAEERAGEIDARRPEGYAALGVMERRLAVHDWLVGDRYSIADVALYAYTHVADEGGYDLEPYPAVCAWLARVAAEPGHVRITQ